MKSAVETLSPTRARLTVEVPFEELKPSLDAAYKTIGQQIQVPGFRKGKVPARVIEQRFGFNRITWRLWAGDQLKGLRDDLHVHHERERRRA